MCCGSCNVAGRKEIDDSWMYFTVLYYILEYLAIQVVNSLAHEPSSIRTETMGYLLGRSQERHYLAIYLGICNFSLKLSRLPVPPRAPNI
ncbi:MAG: hypothetical protein ACTSUE_23060 [Promethearchaeota archaeon]